MTTSSLSRCGDELVEDGVDNRGREHQADGARLRELADELLERRRAGGAILDERRDRISGDVVNDARVPALHQAAHHVGAHPAESDHSELHVSALSP